MSCINDHHHQYHRPTPYNVALAILICLHNDDKIYGQSSSSSSVDYHNNNNNNDGTTRQQPDVPSTTSFLYSDNDGHNNQQQKSSVSIQLRHHVDAFIQHQSLNLSSLSFPAAANDNDDVRIGGGVGDFDSTILLQQQQQRLLYGPSINDLLHQFYHSLLMSSSASSSVAPQQQQQQRNDNDDDKTTAVRQTTTIQTMVTKFYVWLVISTQSLDAFMDLFQWSIQRAVVVATAAVVNPVSTSSSTPTAASSSSASMMDRTSMNGIFLRSLGLGYETLSFVQVTQLYESMKQQIHHGQPLVDVPKDQSTATAATTSTAWIRSSEQVDATIRQYCYHQNNNSNNSNGTSSDNNSNNLAIDGLQQQEYPFDPLSNSTFAAEEEMVVSPMPPSKTSTSTTPVVVVQPQNVSIEQYYPQLPSGHYMQFITAIQNRDRVQANHSIHEFLDMTFIQGHRTTTTTNNNTNNTSSTTTDILQYAAILQALVHVSFQEQYHMMNAIDEAIRVTQQQPPSSSSLVSPPTTSLSTNTGSTTLPTGNNNTNTSTLFAMAWLAIAQQYNTSKSSDNHNNTSNSTTVIALLQRCMDVCRTISYNKFYATPTNATAATTTPPPSIQLMMGIHLLHASMTNSWISHQHALTFYSLDPSSATSKASSNMTTNSTNTKKMQQQYDHYQFDRPIHTVHLDNPLLMTNVIARQKMVAAGIYHSYNELSLSISTIIELLQYYHHNSSTNSNTSYHGLQQQQQQQQVQDTNMIQMAIRNVSLISSTMGSTQIACPNSWCWINNNHSHDIKHQSSSNIASIHHDVSGCIYQQAIVRYISLCDMYHISIFNNQSNNTTNHRQQIFISDLLYVFHEWAIRRHDFDHANAMMMIIENWNTTTIATKDSNNNRMYLKILSLCRQGQYDSVKTMLRAMITTCEASTTSSSGQQQPPRDLVWALLQLSRVYIESNSNEYINALQPILKCLTISKQYKLYGLYHEALLVLAHVHLLMGQCHRTSQILQMILPSLHSSHHICVQAEAYLILAKCRMKQATLDAKQPPTHQQQRRQYKLLLASVQELHRSRTLYEKCHDCRQLQEIHYLLAHVYHHLSIVFVSSYRTNQSILTTPTAEMTSDSYIQLRNVESSNYNKYTKHISISASGATTTSTILTTAQFMSALSSRDGIMMLANRSLAM